MIKRDEHQVSLTAQLETSRLSQKAREDIAANLQEEQKEEQKERTEERKSTSSNQHEGKLVGMQGIRVVAGSSPMKSGTSPPPSTGSQFKEGKDRSAEGSDKGGGQASAQQQGRTWEDDPMTSKDSSSSEQENPLATKLGSRTTSQGYETQTPLGSQP